MSRVTLAALLALSPLASAGSNSPERAQHDAEEQVLAKVNHACGLTLTLQYDAASLAQHNKDISYDQTDGARECNEPLRYAWYLCQDDAGRRALKRAELQRLVCKGTAAAYGSLKLSRGTLTVERAFEEPTPFLRSRAQFEEALKVKVPLPEADPYRDEAWSELRWKPNPVTDTRTSCLVNGERVKFEENLHDPFERRQQDASVQCWKDGEVVVSLTLKKGKKTGFAIRSRDAQATREAWVDDQLHGEQTVTVAGKLKSTTRYERGAQLSRTEYHPGGALARHHRQWKDHQDEVALDANGKLLSLDCSPASAEDPVLRPYCGFGQEVTHALYDGTGKTSRVVSYRDGLLTRQAPGTSHYASRGEVAFRDGKKHGVERVLTKEGTLERTLTWRDGVQHGPEVEYAKDGQRVAVETSWRDGEVVERTERFLNGNVKERLTSTAKDTQLRDRFWDTGKKQSSGVLVRCPRGGWRTWCEEGPHREWYESGALAEEQTWKAGRREGPARRFYESGRAEAVETWTEGHVTARKQWDADGGVTLDEAYEEDGSRKLQR